MDPDSLTYEQHQAIIRDYIKFAKHSRQQNMKFIELQFQDVADASLSEPTYTKDEVEEILQQLKDLVCAEVTAELIAASHTNVLLIVQLLAQAEKWHLRMDVDLSEIQNRERLEKVKEMEETGGKTQYPHRLQPIPSTGDASDLLRMEIDKLQKENNSLEDKVQELETTIRTVSAERAECSALSESTLKDIDSLKKKLDELELITNETKYEDENQTNFTEQLAKQTEICKQLSSDFEALKHEYLSTETKLKLAQQELERKLNQSAAYNNLKKMLLKKNEQVKDLRIQLQKYEDKSDDESREGD